MFCVDMCELVMRLVMCYVNMSMRVLLVYVLCVLVCSTDICIIGMHMLLSFFADHAEIENTDALSLFTRKQYKHCV